MSKFMSKYVHLTARQATRTVLEVFYQSETELLKFSSSDTFVENLLKPLSNCLSVCCLKLVSKMTGFPSTLPAHSAENV